MTVKKHLFVFAHFPEARSFVEHFSAILLPSSQKIFIFKHGLILICGEGIYEALSEVAVLLAQHPDITHVWNLGVVECLISSIKY